MRISSVVRCSSFYRDFTFPGMSKTRCLVLQGDSCWRYAVHEMIIGGSQIYESREQRAVRGAAARGIRSEGHNYLKKNRTFLNSLPSHLPVFDPETSAYVHLCV
jgi:hypothetical protein